MLSPGVGVCRPDYGYSNMSPQVSDHSLTTRFCSHGRPGGVGRGWDKVGYRLLERLNANSNSMHYGTLLYARKGV